VVTRALVALEVLGSIFYGANSLNFNGVVLSVVGDVPVDSEAAAVTSSILRIFRYSKMLIGIGFAYVHLKG
jgi:hypothetical protein